MKTMKDSKIKISTDGSCLGNPGPGGWGAIIIQDKKETEIGGHEKDTTNNRMEMMAMIKALEYLHKKFKKNEVQKLEIELYSDSNLLIKSLNLGWKRKANLDLWEQMDRQRAWLNIKWTWVKAHATDKYNNAADAIAFKEAHKAKKL